MSESERTLVPQGTEQGRRPPVAEMQARIGVLEAELMAAHEREAAMAEVLRQRTRELEESLEYQTATSDVLKVISRSAFDLQAVLDTLVEAAARLCDAGQSGIAIRSGDLYRYVATFSLDREFDQTLRAMTFAPGRGSLAGRVALERQPVHIADLASDTLYTVPQAVLTLGKARTALGVPLLREGDLIGVINLMRQRVEPFTERQIELVRTFADQAVIAMENARLLGELRERTEELTRREAELHNSEERYALAMRAINEGVYEEDVATGEMYYSPRVCELVGLQVSDLRTMKDWTDRIHPDDRGGLRKAVIAHYKGETDRLAHEYRYRHADGTWHWALTHGIALKNEAGRVYRVVGSTGDVTDRKAAEEALREALEQQTATAEVLQVINSSPGELQPVFEAILERAHTHCGATRGTLHLFDGETFRPVAMRGLSQDFAEQLRPGISVRQASLWAPLLAGAPFVHIADLRLIDDPVARAAAERGARTSLALALRKDGALLGLIACTRGEVRPFSDKEIAFLQNFAAQAVIAMENARLLGELRERTRELEESLEYQTATSDVLKVISRSTFDLQPVLDTLVETGQRLCDSDTAALTIREGDVFRYVATRSLDPAWDAFRRARTVAPNRETVAGRAALTGEVVHVPDITTDPDLLPEAATLGRLRTILSVPLRRDGSVVGTLNLGRRGRVAPFTERQIDLVRTFADQAVIAIENTRLLTELRESLEQQQAMAEVLQVINSSPGDLQPVFDAIVRNARRLCGARFGVLHRFDGELLHLAACDVTPEVLEVLRRVYPMRPSRSQASGRAILSRSVAQIPDALDDPEYQQGMATAGEWRSLLAVPMLRADGSPIGTIVVQRSEPGEFAVAHIDMLRTFADQAVIAIDNARLLNELRQRQAELRVTFDNMGDGVAMFDGELRVAAWNLNFQRILDLPDALLAERPSYADYIRILAKRGEFGNVDIEAEAARRVEAIDQELRFEHIRPDGRIIEVRRNPVPGGGFVLIYSDVTERNRAEAQIRAARDTAERALRELQTAQASLLHAQKMAALGQLTAGIAHEIKNPLNFVNNFADLSVELLEELKETAEPAVASLEEDARAEMDEIVHMLTGNLAKIAEHGRRADGIVKSMLAHSRGGSDDWQPSDINALVEEALNLAYHGARAHDQNFNITMERDFAAGIAPVELVPQDLTRVFLNLFGNAFYAADKRRHEGADGFGPMLKVTTRDLGNEVEIRVRDNGTGIAPEFREKLFQPFFTTKPTGEGTGLGLSISWDIVTQQHHGTIAVDSRVGEFTEFTIRLPRVRG